MNFMALKQFVLTHRKALLIALGVLVVFGGVSFFISPPPDPNQPIEGVPTVSGIGLIPALHVATNRNDALEQRVEALKVIDEIQLFSSYREVDGEIANIIMDWAEAGLPEQERAQPLRPEERITRFLQLAFGLPENEPIRGNPLLGEAPWPRLFNRIKARLLIQGTGSRVFDGPAYYDLKTDDIVVEGALSESFLNRFERMLAQQPEPQRYLNSLLVFIDESKGLNKLSDPEKEQILEIQRNLQ